jgi:uncharacterized membrane protein YuzA (DUF378 family)
MKWKLLLNSLVIFAMVGGQSVPAFAAPSSSCTTGTSSKAQVLSGVGQPSASGTPDCSGNGIGNAISTAVNILSIVVGVAAVIMIILSGFKYLSSNGDSAKVTTAKSTLIYALVGVAIASLAQLLVHFVLYQSNKGV